MALLALTGAATSLLEPENNIPITSAFYGTVFAWLLVVGWMVRVGKLVAAGWSLGLFFWGLIAVVTVLFGGLQGQNASVFAVTVLLLGGIVGGRTALSMAVVSSLWCGLIAYLELQGLLPTPLGPYSPVNAWGAMTVTVMLTSVLLYESLGSLSRMHARAQAAALERDQALQRSIQGQKMELVGNLASGIAHDFNNLLTVIRSTSQLLRDTTDPQDKDELADELDEATGRAVLMTRQLLSFGRSRVGKVETVDLSQIADAMGRMLPRLLDSNIHVSVHAPHPAWVTASRAGMEQIFLNLAVNARDAMPGGGDFRVSLELCEGEVKLIAEDTGVGISPEVQRHIFEPFFTTKSTGTGLGLATVKHQVEQFSGTIEVVSWLKKGTRFVVTFPLSHERSSVLPGRTAGELQSASRAQVERGRVILVEDDPLVRRTTARVLTAAGYEVIALSDGLEALGMLDGAQKVSCVVSDISMPRLDGVELADRLARLRPHLPVLLMSGNQDPGLEESSSKTRRYLPKPVKPEELLQTLEELIG